MNKRLTDMLLDEGCTLTLGELSRACMVNAEWLVELVEEGILEPAGHDVVHWRFPGTSLRRALIVMRLQRDLAVNLAGAALVLDLMDEIETLRSHLHALGKEQ